MERLARTLQRISHSAGQVRNGAAEVRAASDDLSQRTEQQAASLEETAAAMDEVTGGVRATASGANRVNAIVVSARQETEESGTVVRRAVEAMGAIERSSSEISEIISVIDGIAFQTNLLALNAGVEAARAGDAGKGFAVVASEVRALAQRSADAARDVKERIQSSTAQVGIGVGLVNETGRMLEAIAARIAEISAHVSQIASSASSRRRACNRSTSRSPTWTVRPSKMRRWWNRPLPPPVISRPKPRCWPAKSRSSGWIPPIFGVRGPTWPWSPKARAKTVRGCERTGIPGQASLSPDPC